MKKYARIASLTLLTVVLCSTGQFFIADAYAMDPLSVHYENVAVSQGTLSIYFNSNAAGGVTHDNLTVSLSGQDLPINNLVTVDAAGEAASYAFIVDVSGSIGAKKLGEIKKLLEAIVDRLSDRDNASFMPLGNNLTPMPFVMGRDNMLDQIAAITSSGENTNLYAGIVKALSVLDTASGVHLKRCVVILSDGEDYYDTGYTKDEVLLKLKSTRAPVYTISMLDKNAKKQVLESAKLLGSFARASAGGQDITYGLDGRAYDDIADDITGGIKRGYILTADLTDVKLDGEQSLLEIILSGSGGETAADSFLLGAPAIRPFISTPPPTTAPGVQTDTPAPTPQASAAPLETPPPQKGGDGADYGLPPALFAAIIVIIVAAAAIAVIALRRKKQAPQAIAPAPRDAHTQYPRTAEPRATPARPRDGRPLRFTKVGINETDCYDFTVSDELIIGRDRAAGFCVPDDRLLSPRHCGIYLSGGRLFIKDLGSTNGTYLNGIPVTGTHPLERDDIILVGSMELRVSFL